MVAGSRDPGDEGARVYTLYSPILLLFLLFLLLSRDDACEFCHTTLILA